MKKTSVTFIRPKDRSYEEYVHVIKSMCLRLGIPFNLTERKLRAGYRQYVAKSGSQDRVHAPTKTTTSKYASRK